MIDSNGKISKGVEIYKIVIKCYRKLLTCQGTSEIKCCRNKNDYAILLWQIMTTDWKKTLIM